MYKKANMQYRKLGNSGLFVSIFGYGNYNSHELISHDEQVKIIKTCLQNGINCFDTAELYSDGKDEEDLGKVLKQIGQPREHFVVSTKIWKAPIGGLNNSQGTNRKHIKQSLKSSLKRLQLDYVDVVYAHSYDEETPIQQICRGFHEIIEDGLAFYWGTSNWDADKIFQAMQVCEKYNLHKPISAENQYNMMNRLEIESEYRVLFEKYHYGLVAYSPLMGGYLSGKYLDDPNAKGRLESQKTGVSTKSQNQFRWYHGVDFEKADKSLRELRDLAQKQLGCDLTALAIAWVAKYQFTSTTLLGARNVEQLTNNLKALEVISKLTPEIEGRINKILGTHPPARMNWKNFTPLPQIRPLAE